MQCPVTWNISNNNIKRNNASIDEIREDPIFNHLLSWEYNNDFLESQDLTQLRILKQALNNQICLFVFNTFVDDFWTMFDWEVPFINENNKLVKIHANSLLELLPVSSFITNIIDLWSIDSLEAKYKWKIIIEYLWAFCEMIKNHFEEMIRNVWNSEIDDIQKVFMILEDYVSNHITNSLSWYWSIDWDTKLLIPNHNAAELMDFIQQWEGKITLEQIKIFLEKQTKEKLKHVKSGKDAIKYNFWITHFCPQNQVYKVLEWDILISWDVTVSQVLPTIHGCPFVSSRSWNKNAFHLMFQMFNNFHMQILIALKEKWLF